MKDFFKIEKMGYYISKEVYTQKQSPPRIVDHFEIELMTKAGHISVINGTSFPQEIGNVLIAVPGDVRYSKNEFECYYVHFSTCPEEIVNRLVAFPKVLQSLEPHTLFNVFHAMTTASIAHKAGCDLFQSAKLLELISLLSDEASFLTSHHEYNRYVRNVYCGCKYIETHFESKLTLADIAKSAHLSGGFFHTVFKTIMGRTPAEYLTEIRLSHAKNLLINSDKSLSELAVSCGFGSQAYFCFLFKKHFRQTPKQYRDRIRPIL